MKTVNFYYTLDKTFKEGLDHRVCRRERDEGKDVGGHYYPNSTGIYLSWNFNGKYYKEAVMQKIRPGEWDWRLKLPAKKLHHELYMLLQTIKTKIETEYLAMRTEGRLINSDTLRDMVSNNIHGNYQAPEKKFFWTCFEEFLAEKSVLTKPATMEKYITFRKMLQSFERAYYPLAFENVNRKWYTDFMVYSIGLGRLTNTVAKDIRQMNTFLKWSYEMKYCRSIERKRFKAETETTDPIFLTKEELALIENYDTGLDSKLAKAKDFFLMCVYTGQRSSDVVQMKRNQLKILSDGSMELEVFQIKGRRVKAVRIFVVKPARIILEKYLNGKNADDYVFAGVSTVVVNRELKKLGELAGVITPTTRVNYCGSKRIEKTLPKFMYLTTHVGRKTYVSQMCASNIPDHEIQSVTGHTSNKSMRVYKGVNQSRVVDGMRMVFE